jgi:hypothetical protein
MDPGASRRSLENYHMAFNGTLGSLPQYTVQENPFDQFDDAQQQAQGNPFDQFDETPQPQADDSFGSFVRGAANAATFNLADPIVAGVQAAFGDPTNPTSNAPSIGERYHENLAALRGVKDANERAHPIAAFAGGVGGSFVNPATRLLPRINSVRTAVGVGAGLGAGYGFGQGVTNDEGVSDTLQSTIEGAGVGGATGGVLRGIGNAVTSKLVKRGLDINSLKRAAQAAYDRADNNGAIVSGGAMQRMVGDLRQKLTQEAIDETHHPQAMAALRRLENTAGQNVTWKGMDSVRRGAGHAVEAATFNKSDRRMGRIIQDHFDDFVDNLQPADLVAGSASAQGLGNAVRDVKQARQLWRSYSQAEMIQENIRKAGIRASGYSQAGEENAIRAQFRKLAVNDKAMRRLDPELRSAVERVARGTPLNLALRGLGKFAPHGLHSAVMGGGAGYTLGGPLGAAAVMGGGELARRLATASTKGLANDAVRVAARVPTGISVPKGLRSLPKLKRAALRGAQGLPSLAPALVPVMVQ